MSLNGKPDLTIEAVINSLERADIPANLLISGLCRSWLRK
jgi:hypothetical protein